VPLTQTVNQAATTTTVTSSPNPSTAGQDVRPAGTRVLLFGKSYRSTWRHLAVQQRDRPVSAS
jgi:hypothetical protein